MRDEISVASAERITPLTSSCMIHAFDLEFAYERFDEVVLLQLHCALARIPRAFPACWTPPILLLLGVEVHP